MPNLPQIFAQPSLPSLRAPSVPRGAFGETFGAQLEQAAGKLFEAQQLVETQTALDKRDELYQQRKLDMMQNPQKYAEMSYPEFLKQFQEGARADDQAVMQDSSFFIRHHLSPLFARQQRHQFDMQSTEYHRLWMDNAQGKVTTAVNEDVRNIVNARTANEANFYYERLNARLNNAGASGIFPQAHIAQVKDKLDHDTIPAGIAGRFINDFDFVGFDQFKKSPLWQGLPENTKGTLETRAHETYERATKDAIRADTFVVNEWMNKHLSEIIKNPKVADWVQVFTQENSKYFTTPNLIYLRERMKQLTGTKSGEDEGPRHEVMQHYEEAVLANGGLTTQAIANKALRDVHDANLGPKLTDEAITKINSDLRQANQIRQGQAVFGQRTTTFNQEQATKKATEAMAAATNPLRMTPERRKQDQELKLQQSLGPVAGGDTRNFTQDKVNMIKSAVEESARTGEDVGPIINRQVDQYYKSIMPQPAPIYTPEEKKRLQRLKELEGQK